MSAVQPAAHMNLNREISEVLDTAIELRHDLHAHPEIAYEEVRTSGRVVEHIKDIPGIELQTGLAGTGIVATLGGEKDGPVVALRADMDALPMRDGCGQAWASTIENRAHTCGHDGHTVALVGAAQVLGGRQDLLKHPVKFIFQPAEEGGAGADRMIQDGLLENHTINAIFGLHGWPALDRGQVGICKGPMLASSTAIEIEITGKGGHAAMPHQTHDPVVASAQIITALQTLVSRNLNPLDSGVVSICKLEGGSTFNVIPGQVKLLGTVRALKQSTRDLLFEKVRSVSAGVAAALNCDAAVRIYDGYPVTENADSALDVFKKSAQSVLTENEKIVEVLPVMGGEDFSFFAQKNPRQFLVPWSASRRCGKPSATAPARIRFPR